MSIREHAAEVRGEFDVCQRQRERAVRVVAAVVADAAECREMLDMLGLDPREALRIPRPRRQSTATPAQERPTTD